MYGRETRKDEYLQSLLVDVIEVGEGLMKVSVLFTEIEGKICCIESLTKVNKLEVLAMKNVREGNLK